MAFYYVTCVRLSFETRAFCSEFRILLLGGGGGGYCPHALKGHYFNKL